MSDNALVADEKGPSAASGTFLGADLEGLCKSLSGGSWVAIGLMGVATAVDLAATYSDPFGSLLAAGFGWVEDHIEPLKGWLNDLTGDAAAVDAYSETWENVAGRMTECAQTMQARASGDLAGAEGAAVDAYREHAKAMAEAMTAAGEAAEATSKALKRASEIIDMVHGVVRDVIAQICGAIVSYAAEFVLSLGLATPLIIEQAETRVADAVAKISSKVTGAVESCKSLEELLRGLDEAIGSLRSKLDLIHPGAARGAHEKPFLERGGRTSSAPGRHAKPWDPGDAALDAGKDLVRGGAEDIVTESSTFDSKVAQDFHDGNVEREGALGYVT